MPDPIPTPPSWLSPGYPTQSRKTRRPECKPGLSLPGRNVRSLNERRRQTIFTSYHHLCQSLDCFCCLHKGAQIQTVPDWLRSRDSSRAISYLKEVTVAYSDKVHLWWPKAIHRAYFRKTGSQTDRRQTHA